MCTDGVNNKAVPSSAPRGPHRAVPPWTPGQPGSAGMAVGVGGPFAPGHVGTHRRHRGPA